MALTIASPSPVDAADGWSEWKRLNIFSSASGDYPASKVPSVVHNTIKAKFPGALDIDWEKNGDSYEAEFDSNGIEYTAYVAPEGKLISYKHDMKVADFPAAIAATINAEYAGYKIDEAEKVEKNNIIYYQVKLESKQKKDLRLIFSADGRPQINY